MIFGKDYADMFDEYNDEERYFSELDDQELNEYVDGYYDKMFSEAFEEAFETALVERMYSSSLKDRIADIIENSKDATTSKLKKLLGRETKMDKVKSFLKKNKKAALISAGLTAGTGLGVAGYKALKK